ncbi:MAG: NblA-related protein, partial [Moorea sp. SIO4A1]|nr:NblA-related protein [Moorena sp. SIO4A1]
MEKHQPIEFSLEQEFNLKVFETQIQNLDLEQAKNLLCELYRQ